MILVQFPVMVQTNSQVNNIVLCRFSVQEYTKFRVMPINEAAAALSESGKIGALNLLFKRHPYSLAPFVLEVLAAIPETLPVQIYGQLLPGRSPPTNTVVRDEDWVECEKMVSYINSLPKDHEIGIQIRTEPIVKQCLGSIWPSTNELSTWYKNRARDIDNFSGQLDNCLCLLDFAICKGISELRQFHEDISYLHQLIYSDDSDGEISLSLVTWEQLSDYDKFRMMLKGVKEENMVKRLRDKALPFMRNRFHYMISVSQGQVTDNHLTADHNEAESFLVRWLKETASENKLDICLMVIDEGCRDIQSNSLFKDEIEAIDCALQCLYLCTVTDKWSTMASILSRLPQIQGIKLIEQIQKSMNEILLYATFIYSFQSFYPIFFFLFNVVGVGLGVLCTGSKICYEGLERRLKLAEGHVEVGRILAFYQVGFS